MKKKRWGRRLTCGGGRPPAPAGHSGSILLRPSQLHWHWGDGFSRDQLPRSSSCCTAGGTDGTDQSSSTAEQGISLGEEEEQEVMTSSTPSKPHQLTSAALLHHWSPTGPAARHSPAAPTLHAAGPKPGAAGQSAQQPGHVRVIGKVVAANTHTNKLRSSKFPHNPLGKC